MKEERDIVKKVLAAQSDSLAADALIEQYMPFIRSEAAKAPGYLPEHEEDELSIAMFAFYEAIMGYRPHRGAFLKLASTAIRNRIIDYRRKQLRHAGHLSLDVSQNGEEERRLVEQIADEKADLAQHQHRADTQAEIGHFVLQLSEFGLSLMDIAENCPKQDRTLQACMRVLDYARMNPQLLEQLVQTKKLPMRQLVLGARVEKKTIERHRKYIVAVLLAYTNGFEIIRDHLQMLKRKEEAAL